MNVRNMSRRLSLSLVVLTGIALGFFAWNTLVVPPTPEYSLSFSVGKRMEAPQGVAQAYFRKEFFVSAPVRNSYLQVAASDSFILYLNGKALESRGPSVENVSDVYDLGPFLHQGKNVLGLEVRRLTVPGAVWAVVEGGWSYLFGGESLLSSDGSWRFATLPQRQGTGGALWYEPDFDDSGWSKASTGPIRPEERIPPLPFPAELVRMPLRSGWLASPEAAVRLVSFTANLSNSDEGTVWARVAARDRFVLTVNDEVAAHGGGSFVETVNLSPFLDYGKNEVQITVTATESTTPRYLFDCFVAAEGQDALIQLSVDSWKTTESGRQAVVLNDYSAFADRFLIKHVVGGEPRQRVGFEIFGLVSTLLLLPVLFVVAWGAGPAAARRLGSRMTSENVQGMDALMHLLPLLFLTCLSFLAFDVDFGPAAIFRPTFLLLAVGLVLLAKGVFFVELARQRHTAEGASEPQQWWGRAATVLPLAVVAALLVIGLIVRVELIDATSLSHDEIGIAILAQDTLATGYPTLHIGSIEKPLSTYELLPFPLAVSMALLGATDFAVRLPAAFFGTLSILLIFLFGRRLWGGGAGAFASLVYTFAPFALQWGTNAFHPQQVQFFALATAYLFFCALEHDEIHNRYLYASALCFVFTYLSWEGSGLLLPAFFLGALAIRRNLSWLKCRALWGCLVVVAVVVFLQLSFRFLNAYPYIVVGQGLSGKTMNLAFFAPGFDPWYYFKNFLWSGNHLLLSVLVLLAAPFAWKDRGFRYLLTVIVVTLVLLTVLLPNASTRYVYFLLPMLMLAAAFVVDKIAKAGIRASTGSGMFTPRVSLTLFSIALPLLVFAASNNQFLSLSRDDLYNPWLSSEIAPIPNYRSTAHFVEQRLEPGDQVMALMPHAFEFYTGRANDYFLQEFTQQQVLFDARESARGYMDKFTGSVVVRNLEELKDVLQRNRRVWIIASPLGTFQHNNSSRILDYINLQANVAYEDYRTRVYLWEY